MKISNLEGTDRGWAHVKVLPQAGTAATVLLGCSWRWSNSLTPCNVRNRLELSGQQHLGGSSRGWKVKDGDTWAHGPQARLSSPTPSATFLLMAVLRGAGGTRIDQKLHAESCLKWDYLRPAKHKLACWLTVDRWASLAKISPAQKKCLADL